MYAICRKTNIKSLPIIGAKLRCLQIGWQIRWLDARIIRPVFSLVFPVDVFERCFAVSLTRGQQHLKILLQAQINYKSHINVSYVFCGLFLLVQHSLFVCTVQTVNSKKAQVSFHWNALNITTRNCIHVIMWHVLCFWFLFLVIVFTLCVWLVSVLFGRCFCIVLSLCCAPKCRFLCKRQMA